MSRIVEDKPVSDAEFKALVDEDKVNGARLLYVVGTPARRAYLTALRGTWGHDYDTAVELRLY